MTIKPAGHATLVLATLLAGIATGQDFPVLPSQESMSLSTLEELARQPGILMVATSVRVGCRHFAMAADRGFGLPIWEIVLYSGNTGSDVLRREFMATVVDHVEALEFEGKTFKVVGGANHENVASLQMWDCGQGN